MFAARSGRHGAGRGRCPGDVRRGDARAGRDGAVAVQPRCDRDEHGGGDEPRDVRWHALLLGICDKIVPGLVIGALRFGHLPRSSCPQGRCLPALPTRKSSGPPALCRRQSGRAELLESESASYHSPGTCTFYGTANSNQMMMELMGLHVPGASFVNPEHPLRTALTRAAVHRLAEIGAKAVIIARWPLWSMKRRSSTPLSACSPPADRPTMPSTLPAMARAAGIRLIGRISTN
jgi:phosphogluconate dehydratase